MNAGDCIDKLELAEGVVGTDAKVVVRLPDGSYLSVEAITESEIMGEIVIECTLWPLSEQPRPSSVTASPEAMPMPPLE